MLTGYSLPTAPSYSVAGTGASILTDVRLSNGRPGQVTRLQWLSAGSPAITDYLDLRMAWAAPSAIGVIPLLGLTCGAGVRIDVTGRRSGDAGYTYALGGNSTSQRTVARSDGRVRHIVVPSATDSLIGIQWRIYNDASGSTWADADTVLDIGEAVGMSAVDLVIESDWQDERVEETQLAWTLGAQPHRGYVRRARRQRTVKLALQSLAGVRAGGLSTGTDWAQLDDAMSGYAPVFSAARWQDAAGEVDAAELHETGLYGVATDIGATVHRSGPWYTRPAMRFQEAVEA